MAVGKPQFPNHGTIQEKIAQAVVDWLPVQAKRIADAMMDRGRAPFAATATQPQALQFYKQYLVNPDGTVNLQNYAELKGRVGEAGVAEIAKQLKHAAQQGKAEELGID